MEFNGFKLDPFQEEAIHKIEEGASVVVSAPTGSGKTVIAEYVIEKAIKENFRVIFTSPIKALSNQKFRNFNAHYGDKVGIQTGDVTINPDAPVLIMTTEIFRNQIYESPERLADITHAIFDEVHFIDDEDRGTVWEESIIFAPKHIQFVCLSATIPNLQDIADWIAKVRETKVYTISENKRVVPLHHHYYVPESGVVDVSKIRKLIYYYENNKKNKKNKFKSKKERFKFDWKAIIKHVAKEDNLPAIYFVFSRKIVEKYAFQCHDLRLISPKESKQAIALFDDLLDKYNVKHDSYTNELRELIGNGISFHHAGIIPTMKEIIERMFTTGLIKLVFATETFALGINMPARTVIFDDVQKYNGISFSYMKTRDYQQMAGRAGRRGMDTVGFVYCNVRIADVDPVALNRVVTGKQESVMSQFKLSFSTIINVYANLGENIFEVHEKNFANFCRGKKGSRTNFQKDIAKQNKLLSNKIWFLKKYKYIGKDGQATDKGRIASLINGYEIQITELYMAGLMQNLSPEALVFLFSTVLYSPRKQDQSDALGSKEASKLRKGMKTLYSLVRTNMLKENIDDVFEKANWNMMAPAYLWAKGNDLDEIERVTNILPGDIIRNLRMVVQLIRQVTVAISEDLSLVASLKMAFDLVNRDEVDAEKQLRLGISID